MSATLFNQDETQSGYRLSYLEVYNWGTFDRKVHRLQTGQQTSLLTGANGSGKTTLVDALLTVLVPASKRFYNQSSGADSKKERDENSYFWGYYGKSYSEEDERSKTEQLRSKADNPYSVLLAAFYNAGTLHHISLVQVRWYSSGSLHKVFIVSPHQLNISEHFGAGKMDTQGLWRRQLPRQFPKTDVFDSFREYATRFSDLFGLKEKALSLFSQTVGIKVLGDLTQFVRSQMLEEPDAEAQFQQLHEHYTDLLLSHKAIRKDEKQLELLEPIIQNKERLAQLEKEKQAFEFVQEQLPFYLNEKTSSLLEQEARAIEEKAELLEARQQTLAEEITVEEANRTGLISQRASLNVDSQVQLIEQRILHETSHQDRKQHDHQQYIKLAKTLELQTDIDERSFKENLDYTRLLQYEWNEKTEALQQDKFSYKLKKEEALSIFNDLQEKIDSLLQRKNRLPQELVNARQQLINLLEVNEAILPFAGELMKVKEDSLHWEDSIERVLHNFSLQLLVPRRYHKQVNAFVHSHNLKARLVYQSIEEKQAGPAFYRLPERDSMLEKLEVKEAGFYTKWIEQQLAERFNYFCTDDLDDFYNSQKAITSNGLVRNGSRHEKDDRPNRWDKLHYTLGWDNQATIRLLMEEKRKAEDQSLQLSVRLRSTEQEIMALNEKLKATGELLYIQSFADIHFQQHAASIVALQKQKDELLQSSDQYQVVLKQIAETEKQLKQLRAEESKIVRNSEELKAQYRQNHRRQSELDFTQLTTDGTVEAEKFMQETFQVSMVLQTLPQLDELRKKADGVVRRKREQLQQTLISKREETLTLINAFCRPSDKIFSEFPDWSGDVMDIQASLHSLPELEDLYKKIRHQRLVEHKRRFRDYMDNSMLDALTNFRTWLDNEEDRIREIIEELNVPLRKITFNKNPDTYLQLECRTNKDVQMRDFRQRLSETIPDVIQFAAQKDEAYRDAVFHTIKTLIEELKAEETWRRKVTDVRNRLLFNAREYSVADHKAGEYHDNTASYSGGQKAQFTYAILGAAIAHQFGIFQPGRQHKSLRFITVDEAFSKLDPEKSRFLMEFCAQLNLQLLVVTPLDKINIAEPYINAVHFVEIKNKRNSIVYNLTMEEYYEKKAAVGSIGETVEP